MYNHLCLVHIWYIKYYKLSMEVQTTVVLLTK